MQPQASPCPPVSQQTNCRPATSDRPTPPTPVVQPNKPGLTDPCWTSQIRRVWSEPEVSDAKPGWWANWRSQTSTKTHHRASQPTLNPRSQDPREIRSDRRWRLTQIRRFPAASRMRANGSRAERDTPSGQPAHSQPSSSRPTRDPFRPAVASNSDPAFPGSEQDASERQPG